MKKTKAEIIADTAISMLTGAGVPTAEEIAQARAFIVSAVDSDSEFFTISRVGREDLESMGYDGSKASDDDMEIIAQAMGEAFTESGAYWDALEAAADYRNIPKVEAGVRT